MQQIKQAIFSPRMQNTYFIVFMGLLSCGYHGLCHSENITIDLSNMEKLQSDIFKNQDSVVLSTSIEQEKQKIKDKSKRALSLLAQWSAPLNDYPSQKVGIIAEYIAKNAFGDKEISKAWQIYKIAHAQLVTILSQYNSIFLIPITKKINEEDLLITALNYINGQDRQQKMVGAKNRIKESINSLNEHIKQLQKTTIKSFFINTHRKEKNNAQVLLINLMTMLNDAIDTTKLKIDTLVHQHGEMLGKMLEDWADQLPDVPQKKLGEWMDKSAGDLPDAPTKKR